MYLDEDDTNIPAENTFEEYQAVFLNKLRKTKLEHIFPLHALLQATGENLNLTSKKERKMNYDAFIAYHVMPIENNQSLLEKYDFENFNDFVKRLRRKPTKKSLLFWKDKGPLSDYYDENINNLDRKILTSVDANLTKRSKWMGQLEGLKQAREDILSPLYSSLLAKRFAHIGEFHLNPTR